MTQIDDAQFNNLDKQGKRILLFYSNTCPLCVPAKMALEQLEKQHTEIKFMAIDYCINKQAATMFGIVGVPCVLLIQDNQVQIYHGARTKSEYSKIIHTTFVKRQPDGLR